MADNSNSKALIYAFTAALFFSVMGVLATRLGKSLPVGQVAFFRVFVSLVFLFPYMKLRKIPLLGKSRKLIFLRGLVGFISLSLGFFALTKIPMGEVSVLWKSSIIFTALFSALFLKEKVTSGLIICILLAFAGACLVLKPSADVINVGGFAALMAGIFVAMVAVSIRKLHQTEQSDTIIFGFCLWGSVLGLLVFGHEFVMPDSRQALLLLSIGLTGLLGQMSFTRAFRYAPAAVVQPLTFVEVIISSIFGYVFFDQKLDYLSVIGAAAIILAGMGILRK